MSKRNRRALEESLKADYEADKRRRIEEGDDDLNDSQIDLEGTFQNAFQGEAEQPPTLRENLERMNNAFENILDNDVRKFLVRWLIAYNAADPEPIDKEDTESLFGTSDCSVVKSYCRNIGTETEMTIQLMTISILCLEIFKQAIDPHSKFLQLECNAKFDSQSAEIALEGSARAKLATKLTTRVHPDLTLRLRSDSDVKLKCPIYTFVVEVQKQAMSDVYDHKDFFKVCFMLRSNLKDCCTQYSNQEFIDHSRGYGALCSSNGIVFLCMKPKVESIDSDNFQTRIVTYELRVSRLYEYAKEVDLNEVKKYLITIGLHSKNMKTLIQKDLSKDLELLNTAKANKATSSIFDQHIKLVRDITILQVQIVEDAEKLIKQLISSQLFAGTIIHEQVVAASTIEDTLTTYSLLSGGYGVVTDSNHISIVISNSSKICNFNKICIAARRYVNSFTIFMVSLHPTSTDVIARRYGHNNGDGRSGGNADEDARSEDKHSDRDSMSSSGDSKPDRSNTASSSQLLDKSLNLLVRDIFDQLADSYQLIWSKIHGDDKSYICSVKLMSESKGEQTVFAKFANGTDVEKQVMKNLMQVEHPNICRVYYHGQIEDGICCELKTADTITSFYYTITEELVPAEDWLERALGSSVSVHQRMTILCHVMKGVLNGIACLHNMGIMHLDISLHNVMFRMEDTQNMEILDPVLIDMNYSQLYKGKPLTLWDLGTVGTRPFLSFWNVDYNYCPLNDNYSAGVLFAHYFNWVEKGTLTIDPEPEQEYNWSEFVNDLKPSNVPPILSAKMSHIIARLVAKKEERIGLIECIQLVTELQQSIIQLSESVIERSIL